MMPGRTAAHTPQRDAQAPLASAYHATMNTVDHRTIRAVALLAFTGPVCAQALPSADIAFDDNARPWTITFEGHAWRAATEGDFSLAGGTVFTDQSLGVDEPVFGALGKLTFRYDRWAVRVSGFDVQSEGSAQADEAFTAGSLAVARGDALDMEFDYFIVDASVGYRFRIPFDDTTDDVAIWIEPFLGGRVYDLSLDLEQVGVGSTEGSLTAGAILGGAALTFELTDAFFIEVEADGAGGPDALAFQIDAWFAYRPVEFAELGIGFRHVMVELGEESEDDLSFDGFTAGLYFGAAFRF